MFSERKLYLVSSQESCVTGSICSNVIIAAITLTSELMKMVELMWCEEPSGSGNGVVCLHAGTSHPEHEKVEEVLTSVGFTQEMQQAAVASLSGGWKMKLALARAMLMEADILLLDEPTNHLDVNNVAWLQSYLTSLTSVTSMVVSHDSGFLDAVCTDIIHYEDCKLKRYRVSSAVQQLDSCT